MKKLIATSFCIVSTFMMTVLPIAAYSKSSEANLPNSNWKIQSNVWQSATPFYGTHEWAVSAKMFTKSGTRVNAERIKTTYNFNATGIGVSVSGVSGSTGGGRFSGSWENGNAWISDVSGTFKLGGAPLYSNFSNEAFALKSGVKASTSATVFRVY